MKTLREDALVHQDNGLSLDVWTKVLDSDEEKTALCLPSFFGPCCTNGCQYCHPNCHEHSDSSNYF